MSELSCNMSKQALKQPKTLHDLQKALRGMKGALNPTDRGAIAHYDEIELFLAKRQWRFSKVMLDEAPIYTVFRKVRGDGNDTVDVVGSAELYKEYEGSPMYVGVYNERCVTGDLRRCCYGCGVRVDKMLQHTPGRQRMHCGNP